MLVILGFCVTLNPEIIWTYFLYYNPPNNHDKYFSYSWAKS